MKRTLALATLCAAASLTACKEPQGDPGVGLVRGGQGVAMESVRVYAGEENASDMNAARYYVGGFAFTNTLELDLVPCIGIGIGIGSGRGALVGLRNVGVLLARSESHDDTVGFRVPQGTQGTLFYDAAF